MFCQETFWYREFVKRTGILLGDLLPGSCVETSYRHLVQRPWIKTADKDLPQRSRRRRTYTGSLARDLPQISLQRGLAKQLLQRSLRSRQKHLAHDLLERSSQTEFVEFTLLSLRRFSCNICLEPLAGIVVLIAAKIRFLMVFRIFYFRIYIYNFCDALDISWRHSCRDARVPNWTATGQFSSSDSCPWQSIRSGCESNLAKSTCQPT